MKFITMGGFILGGFSVLFFGAHLAMFLMRDCRIVGKQHDLVLRGHQVIPVKH